MVNRAARGGEDGDHTVSFVAAHVRKIDRKQPPDLLGDRREHLPRRRVARDERRDPPQRGLLLGQHAQLLTAHRRSPFGRALGANATASARWPPRSTRQRRGHRAHQQRRHARVHRLASVPLPHRYVDLFPRSPGFWRRPDHAGWNERAGADRRPAPHGTFHAPSTTGRSRWPFAAGGRMLVAEREHSASACPA